MSGSFEETSAGLLIPAAERTTGCVACGDRIPVRQLDDHVVGCVKRHRDELAAEAVEQAEDLFPHDNERWRWLRTRGAQGG